MKRNDEIQIEADNIVELKLMALFQENNLEYKQHESSQKKEKGVDYYCHVFNRDTQKQVLFFETQNKGTNTPVKVITDPKHNEKGKMSFQLELRHVKQYYHELTEPLIFIYTDITTKDSYWYSIQLDSSLEERIVEKDKEINKAKRKSNQTIQIYISPENLINQENFKNFINDIQLSREHQYFKHNTLFEVKADYSFIKNDTKDYDIVDKILYTIDLFEGITVIPVNIISNLYPFKGSQRNTYVWDSTFKTDNEEFYDFMDSIEKSDGKLIIKETNYDLTTFEKLDKIVKFFRVNCIDHISWQGKSKKENVRICVHKLHIYSVCNCERCNYYKLNFIETKNLIDVQNDDDSLHVKLRKGYTSSLMGRYDLAIMYFKQVDKLATKNEKIIYSTIAKFNLIKLQRIISNSYWDDDRGSLLEILKNEKIEGVEAKIKIKAPHFFDLYKWIKDENFFERAFWNIDIKLEEIKKMSFHDKYGARYTNSYDENLIVSFQRLYYFLEFNLIIYNSFSEYKQLTTKVLEGVFALYTIKNRNTTRFKKFNLIILNMWIFNVRFEDANHLLKKYNIHKIEVENKKEIYNEFNSYLENLNSSLSIVNLEKNRHLIKNVELILSNLTLIVSRIKFEENDLNNLIEKLFKIIEKTENRNFMPSGALVQLFSHQKKISTKNIKLIILNLKENHFEHTSVFSYAIKYYVEKSTPIEIENLLFELLDIKDFSDSSLFAEENKFETLGYAISFLSVTTRENIKKVIKDRLKIEFNSSDYQLAAIYDLIDYDEELLNKFAKDVPDLSKKSPDVRSFFNDTENYRLGQLINLIYKYKIGFSDDVKKLSSYSFQKDYYDWLMDLDGFDYSKFKHYWILDYQVKYYFEAFKKSKILKRELKKALKKDYIEGVAKIYIDIYN